MEEPRRLGGRYELGSVLGRGGMAEVYLAHDTRLGRTVAVKTLRVDLARDPSFQARFRREAQSAASLNHPSIVAVYDTGEDYVDGVSIPYIVMEYVDGSTLRELLHSGRKLLPERSLEMTTGVLQALEYSHRAGIVHRDIKPANVMLTRTGQVKVMDFGIARAMGDAGMTMTQTAAVIGTAQYLSPEQAKGEQVDARSDLYSTGCLLYELLTVRPPFVGDSPVAVAYQHVREEPQKPSNFDPEITPEMDAIVLKALVKDPDYRYQSADEMRADIEAALDGQPVAAASAMGAAGYDQDQPTTMLRPQDPAGQTSMLPPMNADDGGYGYDDRGDRRRGGGQKKSNTSTILLVLAAVLVLVGAIFIGKAMFTSSNTDGKVSVPDLVGKTRAEAKDSGRNGGFKVSEAGRKACDNVKKGQVTEQSPEAGKTIDKNDTVDVTMCTGAVKVTVPDVEDLAFESARDRLERKGFKNVKKVPEESDRTPGIVLKQNPAGQSEAPKSTVIVLTVAQESPKRNVPPVTGQDFETAKKQLDDLGFEVSKTEQEVTDPNQVGKVLSQSPDGNTPAKEGSTVTLTVGKAGAQTPVPSVVGQTVKEAKKALQQAGFTNIQFAGGSQDDNARVAAQDPQPQTPSDPKTTTVTLTTIGGGGNGNGGNGGDDGGGFIGGPFG
ncbi:MULTISPECIES: Stk1 family PASTA domain-containing Ser/Thr kinase [Streptomyces]|uniref:non-specific serine/threonine protein kinase n=2 Tax=Streptomyces nigrescens TaxID=1920 RepID=A0A640TJS3_STRNI|nr:MULTISPECIES: Stk1 family PASTA domain-containing Ser/Thr kinase [Streptomyces]MCX5444690.1 Stk1 family PASTA domain-containing Ser/Thr kinase [Streptomyces libani]WAT97926.1 Stk1 family PASTA domain-containing Ser/Thr kinase [Streptomyces libani subsp. libani]WAU05886.1 Stk1 family PASTA domain-containing Ser/Thr kinase [Streptomyces nigrescens]WDT56324.1 Stk1 family PASTA domain-containing Ser/Thr kinase [Streptomyces sp. G7(2002)]GFE23480.1 putative serine/threonine-protein kinase [Strep